MKHVSNCLLLGKKLNEWMNWLNECRYLSNMPVCWDDAVYELSAYWSTPQWVRWNHAIVLKRVIFFFTNHLYPGKIFFYCIQELSRYYLEYFLRQKLNKYWINYWLKVNCIALCWQGNDGIISFVIFIIIYHDITSSESWLLRKTSHIVQQLDLFRINKEKL